MQQFDTIKHSKGIAWHPVICRWWLRSRICKNPIKQFVKELNKTQDEIIVKEDDLTIINPKRFTVWEFYIPWWAWPLELLHRLIFGKAILYKLEKI